MQTRPCRKLVDISRLSGGRAARALPPRRSR